MSIRAVVRILGRSPATVSRELTLNSSRAGYASVLSQALSAAAAARVAVPPSFA
uniref:hypothetical protein n=1 Tax=Caballeronia arationis TaxID=1777142 RepID=UPI0035B544DF